MALNKCIFIGRLTRDVEYKTVGDNVPVANFTIAVDRNYKSNGAEQPETDFISIIAWRKSAEFANKFFCKGRQVSVCGSLETYTWDKSDGTKGYGFQIKADELGFADSARNGNANNDSADNKENKPSDDGGIEDFPVDEDFAPIEDFDDDLPFD